VADFDTIYAGFKAIVADLGAADQAALFHDNAVRFYRLGEARAAG
jgi:predicted TIM-barrel fold metal-dependent hydrolase